MRPRRSHRRRQWTFAIVPDGAGPGEKLAVKVDGEEHYVRGRWTVRLRPPV